MKRSLLKTGTAWMTLAAFVNQIGFTAALAAAPAASTEPPLTLATTTTSAGGVIARDPSVQTSLTLQQKIALLRQKVKYVFVLFQENRSYDHYFGTYPGANGLFTTYPGASPTDPYAMPGKQLASFNSVIRDCTTGTSNLNSPTTASCGYTTISPFLIPRTILNTAGQTVQLYPESLYSVDHSHGGYINDFHADQATKSIAQNDGYALDQEGLHYSTDVSGTTIAATTVFNSSNVTPTAVTNLQSKQKGEVVMSHVDCDTVPFLWQYADQFVLFDNFHQTATGPSTPNAIAMIAGQTGDTQWVKHPSEGDPTGLKLPNLTDSPPFPGSVSDTAAVKPPYGPDEATTPYPAAGSSYTSLAPQINLTFASLPLSFMGSQIGAITRQDQHPSTDLIDVQHDISVIAAKNPAVNWGWYQQGYGPEPFDGQGITENGVIASSSTGAITGYSYDFSAAGGHTTTGAPEHASYIVHHNGPQYFGYIGDNKTELGNMHGLQQFYTDVANQALPASGGVFYVRGGYYNNDGLLPADPNPNVKAATPGNDDHPNYSDAQISEAMIADSVNAIAASPYWNQSAIIITYDETDGQFDHQPEQFRTYGPDGQPETGGPRIPTIVISPFAAVHTVSHVYSEQSSVIKFINEVFGLTPLAALPDEAAAIASGSNTSTFNGPNGPQANLGPADNLAAMGDLLEAFDNDRLLGNIGTLPNTYAMIAASPVPANPAIGQAYPASDLVHTLPHYVTTLASGAPQYGCQALGIVPTDYPNGVYATGTEIDPPPADFNPRPVQSPGVPSLNTNNNTGQAPTGAWPN